MARSYRDFGFFTAPTILLRNVSRQLPIIMLAAAFPAAVVGFYAMANRLAHVPVTLVTQGVRRVYLQKIAELNNQGRDLRKPYYKATAVLAVLGAVPFGFIWLFGEEILSIVLGPEWTFAGQYVEYLVPYLFTIWLMPPTSSLVVVLRRQKFWLKVQIGLFVMRVAVFALAVYLGGGPESVIRTYAYSNAVIQIAIIILAYNVIFGSRSGEATV